MAWRRGTGMCRLECIVRGNPINPLYRAWVPADLPLEEAAELATDIFEQDMGRDPGLTTYYWWDVDGDYEDGIEVEREYPDPDAE